MKTLPDFPEPDFFTLQQICERWHCDEEHLIQYCRSNMLKIGVILENSNGYQLIKGFGKVNSKLSGFYELSSADVEGTYYCGENPRDEYSCNIKKVYLSGSVNDFELDRTHIFSSESLVIAKSERNRFEEEHNLNFSSVINDNKLPDKPLDPREKNTWARIVKILCLELRMELDKPYVIAEMIQALAAKHGVLSPKKNDTIAKRIQELPED